MRVIYILIIWLLMLGFAKAESHPEGIYSLRNLAVLVDDTRQLNFAQVQQTEYVSQFKKIAQTTANFGFSRANYWLIAEFTSADSVSLAVLEIANPRLDEVGIYLLRAGNIDYQYTTGDQQAFSQRAVRHRNFVFPLSLQANTHYQLLIKVNSRDDLLLPIQLSSIQAFGQNLNTEVAGFGMFYGALSVVIISNLFFFIVLRDKYYLHLALFLTSVSLSLMVSDGIAMQVFWPNALVWAKYSLVFSQTVSMLLGLLFSYNFLQLKFYSPNLAFLVQGLFGVFVIFLGVSPFIDYQWAISSISVLILLVAPIIFLAAVICWRKQYRPARYFLIAWSMLLAGAVVLGLMVNGLVPFNYITSYGFHFGVLWLAVMLSVALADRLQLLQKEKVKAQDLVIGQQQVTMAYQKKMVESISRFVPQQFLTLLERFDITDVKYGDAVLKNMNIMFSDIRGFTALSEAMSSEDNFRFLNLYMTFMEPAINENKGFIDKFIGDAIMALFPEAADQAVKAGIAMHEQLHLFNVHSLKEGLPEIKIGIGIHGGDVMLGTLGSDTRLETTVIGDAVNVASRLESLTKIYSAAIIISEHLYQGLQAPEDFMIRTIGRVPVRGKKEALLIYEVFDTDSYALRMQKQKTVALLSEAVQCIDVKQCETAKQLLNESLSYYPDDPVAKELLALCAAS